jgi:predicted acyl esterase
VARRFAAGNRIRLLIAGGSFPRWERNFGTGEGPCQIHEDGALSAHDRSERVPCAASNARLTVGRSIVSESGTRREALRRLP